jgi:hypothetical protein
VINAIRTLDKANREAGLRSLQTLPSRNTKTILPVSSIRAQLPVVTEGIRKELGQQKLAPVESAKLATLLAVQTTPYFCEPATMQAPLGTLLSAGTVTEVETASRQLMNVLQHSHHHVVTKALVVACQKASVQAGFESIETATGIDGCHRVIATDTNGRALVTEVRADYEREPSIETEVVGVTDGSCVEILDRFDRALDEQGVKASPQDRKWTGGVCELHSAKEFLKKKIKPSRDSNTEAIQRARRLNSGTKIRSH